MHPETMSRKVSPGSSPESESASSKRLPTALSKLEDAIRQDYDRLLKLSPVTDEDLDWAGHDVERTLCGVFQTSAEDLTDIWKHWSGSRVALNKEFDHKVYVHFPLVFHVPYHSSCFHWDFWSC